MSYMTKGFGLIEMMVTIALVAILATVAVPSFRRLVNKTRINSEANSLVDAFHTARSYAVRNDTVVKFCAGKTCNSSNKLSAGWVIEDKSANVIQFWSPPKATVKSCFKGSTTFKPIKYGADGLQPPLGSQSGHVNICSGSQALQLFLNAFGHIRTQSVNRPSSSCKCGTL